MVVSLLTDDVSNSFGDMETAADEDGSAVKLSNLESTHQTTRVKIVDQENKTFYQLLFLVKIWKTN